MIGEYALDPEIVASGHDLLLGRLLIEGFGFGKGRVVSRFPKNWPKLVWEAFDGALGATAGLVERTRVEELLVRLRSPETRRWNYVWDDDQSWLENVEDEYARSAFHAILARDNPRNNAAVMVLVDVLAGVAERWKAPGSIVVNRTASSMAAGVEGMLRCATQVLFVDPHFRASRSRFRNPLEAFLQLVRRDVSRTRIELHAGNVDASAPAWSMFKGECEHHLPRVVPTGLELKVRRWKNCDGGERLHNRYILSDVGGVQFGVGLDEGDQGTTDDVTLLGAEAHRRRLEEYGGSVPAFELDGEITIDGEAGGSG